MDGSDERTFCFDRARFKDLLPERVALGGHAVLGAGGNRRRPRLGFAILRGCFVLR